MLNYSAAFNAVVIDPDSDFGEAGGFILPNEFDTPHHYSITGTVVAAPERLISHGRKLARLERYKSQRNADIGKRLARMSCEYETEVEVSAGDRVMYMFTAKLDPARFLDTGYLVVRYDMLYCKVVDGAIIPLNGNIFVEPIEKERWEEVLPGVHKGHDDLNKYGVGVIKYIGKPVKSYLRYRRPMDNTNYQVGDKVAFRPGAGHRMEMDIHNTLTNKQTSLLVIHRKDILLYEH